MKRPAASRTTFTGAGAAGSLHSMPGSLNLASTQSQGFGSELQQYRSCGHIKSTGTPTSGTVLMYGAGQSRLSPEPHGSCGTCTEPCWVASSGARKRGWRPPHQDACLARAAHTSRAATASSIFNRQQYEH